MRVRWCGLGAVLVVVGGSAGCGVVEDVQAPTVDEAVSEDVREAEDDPGPSAQWKQPSSSCEGVVPRLPEPRLVSFSRMSESCLRGTTDGEGNLALGLFATSLDSDVWSVYSPEGRRLGELGSGFSTVLPQRRGFHFVALHYGIFNTTFEVFTPTGERRVYRELLGSSEGFGRAVVDPRGGSAVATLRAGPGTGPWKLQVQRFNTPGRPSSPLLTVAEGTGAAPGTFALGADTEGRTLVVWSEPGGGRLRGRWLLRNETFTRTFTVQETFTSAGFVPVLSPLIGGGLALRVEGRWVAELPSRKTEVRPAPAWLASAPAWHSLTLVRGGRAYALAPDVGAEPPASCQSTVFLHAPAGNRCGALTLPEGACRAGQLGIGRDGTLVELLPEPVDNTCAYRYWTGLLR